MRLILSLFATTRRALMLLALVGSLALNVATVTSTAVFSAVSGAVSAVAGVSTVAGRAAMERQAQRRAVTQTTRRVQARAARSAGRAVASSAAEAIPVAGVAVIVAALAWEVQAACDTARDMAVLEAMLDDPTADPEVLGAAYRCTDLIPAAEDLPTAGTLWSQVVAAPGLAWEQAQSLYGDAVPASPRAAIPEAAN